MMSFRLWGVGYFCWYYSGVEFRSRGHERGINHETCQNGGRVSHDNMCILFANAFV